jgi:hypothetical protein
MHRPSSAASNSTNSGGIVNRYRSSSVRVDSPRINRTMAAEAFFQRAKIRKAILGCTNRPSYFRGHFTPFLSLKS